jgi:hypothetical protein
MTPKCWQNSDAYETDSNDGQVDNDGNYASTDYISNWILPPHQDILLVEETMN